MKLRKVLAGAMALVMVAGSLLVAPVEAKAAESDSKTYEKVAINEETKTLVLEEGSDICELNAKVEGQFLNGGVVGPGDPWPWGDDYTLSGEFDVTLKFYLDAFVRDASNWSSFLMEFKDTTDTKGVTLRADNWGWTFGEGSNVPSFVGTVSWDWAQYQTLTDNQNVSLNVKKTSGLTEPMFDKGVNHMPQGPAAVG